MTLLLRARMLVPCVALAHLAVAALALSAGVAAAQDVCVECTGPAAKYRCSIKDFDKIAKYKRSGKLLEYVCITELARAGRHASCRAGNAYQGLCIGQPRELDASTLGNLPQALPDRDEGNAASRTAAAPGAVDRRLADPGAAPNPVGRPAQESKPGGKPPQTLEELARNSKLDVSGVKKSVNNAGKAVSGAVKNSWRCLTTLFSDC